MGRFQPVLDWREDWAKRAPSPVQAQWKMSGGWAFLTGLTLFLGIAFMMRGSTEFIYFNF
jgi:hypothetical protein